MIYYTILFKKNRTSSTYESIPQLATTKLKTATVLNTKDNFFAIRFR